MKKESTHIYGIRAIMEAIDAGKTIDKVFLKKGLQGDLYGDLYKIVKDRGIEFQFVPIEKLNRLTRNNHQGAIALTSPIEYYDLEQLLPTLFEKGEVPLILILDSITDVRNMGAIARTAECAGVHAIVIPTKGMAQINEDAIKTSAGALLKIPVCKVRSLPVAAEYLKACGLKIAVATEKADSLYTETDLTGPLALIMGSEDIGPSPTMIRLSDTLLKIPMAGTIESLNVSVSAGIIIYEIIRQRT